MRSELKVPEGTHVVLFKIFEDLRNDLAGDFDAVSLIKFIKEYRYPLVLPFDRKVSIRFAYDNSTVFFLMYKKDEVGLKAQKVFYEAAQRLRGKIQFSKVDVDDENYGRRFVQFYRVAGSDSATIIINGPLTEHPKRHRFDRELTAENLLQFYEDYKAGRPPLFLRSESIPVANDQPVKIVVGKTFNEIVLDPTKNVFIALHALSWNPIGKQLSPTWDEFAAELSEVKNLVIAKMDINKNEVESFAVRGSLPALRFYPADNKNSPLVFDFYKDDLQKKGLLLGSRRKGEKNFKWLMNR